MTGDEWLEQVFAPVQNVKRGGGGFRVLSGELHQFANRALKRFTISGSDEVRYLVELDLVIQHRPSSARTLFIVRQNHCWVALAYASSDLGLRGPDRIGRVVLDGRELSRNKAGRNIADEMNLAPTVITVVNA